MPERCQRYSEMTPTQVRDRLKRAQPDLIDGVGQDAAALRKAGYTSLDDQAQSELARASTGFDGVERLGNLFIALLDAPAKGMLHPPWQNQVARRGIE